MPMEATRILPPINAVELDRIDLDPFWGLDFMTQDMLPAPLTNAEFPDFASLTSNDTPKKSTFSQFSSRLPALEDIEDGGQDDAEIHSGLRELESRHRASADAEPWIITESCYERFYSEMQDYSAVLPGGCSIPAQSTLIRCLEKYLRCAQEFLPFIHCTTFRADQKSTEL
ncbi:Nn.00g067640.m01.CDS01 [Neocucurbitaria sp. VM-36]